MQIIAQCPFCENSWILDDDHQDKRIRCKKCRRIFRVPKLDEIPKAADVIRESKSSVYVDESGKMFG
ncbi:MAG: hypothetical protein JXA96_00230 [Sedimentisphaerales bacterium]|nr:hypothetical protein [Sedimentisphaerales bacterium]